MGGLSYFSNVKSASNPRNKALLRNMLCIKCCLILFDNIGPGISACIFTMDIDLSSSLLNYSFCGVGVKGIVISYNKLRSIPPASISYFHEENKTKSRVSQYKYSKFPKFNSKLISI